MKKVTFTVLAALAIGLTAASCNKDDDNEIPAPSLIGQWNYSQEGSTSGTSEILAPYSGNEDGCTKDFMIFNTNNTLLDVDFDSFDTPCEKTEYPGTYALNGNSIVVDFGDGDGPQTATIVNLSYTELKVKSSDGYILVLTR